MKSTHEECELGYLYIEIPPKNPEHEDLDDPSNYAFDKHIFHTFTSNDKVFAVVLPEPKGKFSSSFYIPWTKYNELRDNNKLNDYLQTNFP